MTCLCCFNHFKLYAVPMQKKRRKKQTKNSIKLNLIKAEMMTLTQTTTATTTMAIRIIHKGLTDWLTVLTAIFFWLEFWTFFCCILIARDLSFLNRDDWRTSAFDIKKFKIHCSALFAIFTSYTHIEMKSLQKLRKWWFTREEQKNDKDNNLFFHSSLCM